MTISTERPADVRADEVTEGAPPSPEDLELPDPRGGEDGATTPGGPRMILIFVSIFGAVVWLRRRYRK